MTLNLQTKVPPRCVCCDLYLGPEARMGVCGDCVNATKGNALWCAIHSRRIVRIPELR